jgi:hypothetical protein
MSRAQDGVSVGWWVVRASVAGLKREMHDVGRYAGIGVVLGRSSRRAADRFWGRVFVLFQKCVVTSFAEWFTYTSMN